MTDAGKSSVTVVIGGEEYTIRAGATPEYTRRCAAYLDGTLDQVLQQASLVEAQKGVILAALALTDQLFLAREELETLRGAVRRFAAELSEDAERAVLGGRSTDRL